MIVTQLEGRTLTKAHGTGNDFVLVPDFDNRINLTPADVAHICDRHRGVGADGLIRVVRSQALTNMAEETRKHPEAQWFMDYRNADGSLAEMCGNGVRVFVHYLRIQGIVDMMIGSTISVLTRGGVKKVTYDGPTYTVDMGEYKLPFGTGEKDTRVDIPGLGTRHALSVAMPNPHSVVLLESLEELRKAQLTLDNPPLYTPIPPQGTNLELAVPGHPTHMRVLERGAGETLACGTGTCAVALAVLLHDKKLDAQQRFSPQEEVREKLQGVIDIESPGGPLTVKIDKGRAYLTGEAVLVAEVTLIGIAGYCES